MRRRRWCMDTTYRLDDGYETYGLNETQEPEPEQAVGNVSMTVYSGL